MREVSCTCCRVLSFADAVAMRSTANEFLRRPPKVSPGGTPTIAASAATPTDSTADGFATIHRSAWINSMALSGIPCAAFSKILVKWSRNGRGEAPRTGRSRKCAPSETTRRGWLSARSKSYGACVMPMRLEPLNSMTSSRAVNGSVHASCGRVKNLGKQKSNSRRQSRSPPSLVASLISQHMSEPASIVLTGSNAAR